MHSATQKKPTISPNLTDGVGSDSSMQTRSQVYIAAELEPPPPHLPPPRFSVRLRRKCLNQAPWLSRTGEICGQRLCILNTHTRYKARNKNDNLRFVDFFFFFFDVMFLNVCKYVSSGRREEEKKERGGEPEETGFSVFCLEL